MTVTSSPPESCPHGGAFFQAIGETFDDLDRRHEIINADVLDAWFDPAPTVVQMVRDHLPWLARTSPPIHAAGLCRRIAEVRGVDPAQVVVGAGSSQLIHLGLADLAAGERVLIPEPSYGEYRHIVRHRHGVEHIPFPLDPGTRFRLPVGDLVEVAQQRRCTLVILVNPNNPTGAVLDRGQLERLIAGLPRECRLWIDETYVDFAGPGISCEAWVGTDDRLIVCKSLSKAYALSGLRVAYLLASPQRAARLRAALPPWHCSLVAQVAAVEALGPASRHYYTDCWRQSVDLRRDFFHRLAEVPGIRPFPPGVVNALLCEVDPAWGTAADLVTAAAARGLFLRDCSALAACLGGRHVRISVKDRPTNERIAVILQDLLAA